MTTIQLIRYVREAIESDVLDSQTEKNLYQWLTKQLNKQNTIVIEVAKTMVSMKSITNYELTTVITSLGLFLMSSSNVNTFSALKILNTLS